MNKKRLIIFSLVLFTILMFKVNAEPLFMKIDDTVEIDSSVNITLYLDNIKYDNFTFKLYSSETLSSVNSNDINLTNNNEEISFDYCINCSTLKTIVLNYKLPSSVNIGDNITFYAQIINKGDTSETVDFRKVVTVIEKVKEETNDTEEDNKDKSKFNFSGNNNRPNLTTTNSNGKSSTPGVSTKYKGSTNNYLSNITIKGYELNKSFMKERLTYFVTVPNNVKSLDIKTTKEDSKSNVSISGNGNFEVGLNKVLITVTAQDGRVKNYRLYVTRLESDTNEE